MIDRRRIVHAIGDMAALFSPTFLVPAVVAFLYEPWDAALGTVRVPGNSIVFAACGAFALSIGLLLKFSAGRADDELVNREAYLTVGLGWLVLTVLAALPFLATGTTLSLVDAWFESMSGLTTTGASALSQAPEDLDASVSFWRALLQWLGGIGIIVLFVAVISSLTTGGLNLLQAEASAHLQSRLRPKLAETARLLWRLYLVVSAGIAAVFFLLMLRLGLPYKEAAYDAVYHTFTTYSTGGFSSHAQSMGFYGDVWLELATIVSMFLGATSFVLLYGLRAGAWRQFVRDPQLRTMLGVYAGATLAVVAILLADGHAFWAALRGSAFATATTLTGTGLVTSDFSAWPLATSLILLLLMLMGGNAGSTSGAIKTVRFVVLAKVVRRELRRLLHPRAVVPIRMGHRTVPEELVSKVVAFFFTYLTLWVMATLAVVAIDPALDIVDGASATASTLGNVGVGLGAVGPTGSYAQLQPATKLILSGLMWLGRLELFTAMLLFSPSAWRK